MSDKTEIRIHHGDDENKIIISMEKDKRLFVGKPVNIEWQEIHGAERFRPTIVLWGEVNMIQIDARIDVDSDD